MSETITLTRAEYEDLLDRLEDAEDRAAIAEHEQAVITRGADAVAADAVPANLVDRLIEGESPLRIWRERRGMTQAMLAEKSGVSNVYLHEIEAGKKRGSVEAIKKIAWALQIPTDLLTGEITPVVPVIEQLSALRLAKIGGGLHRIAADRWQTINGTSDEVVVTETIEQCRRAKWFLDRPRPGQRAHLDWTPVDLSELGRQVLATSRPIHVDASEKAVLINGNEITDCPTLQEAVLAWHDLPENDRGSATIRVVPSGLIYSSIEIGRLRYSQKP